MIDEAYSMISHSEWIMSPARASCSVWPPTLRVCRRFAIGSP